MWRNVGEGVQAARNLAKVSADLTDDHSLASCGGKSRTYCAATSWSVAKV